VFFPTSKPIHEVIFVGAFWRIIGSSFWINTFGVHFMYHFEPSQQAVYG